MAAQAPAMTRRAVTLWERTAGGATSVLTVAVLARLAVTRRPAARARRLGPAAGEVA